MSWLEWAIGLRYTIVGRGDRFVSFSSIASAVGIALGVAAIIVVMAVMNGFHLNLRDRILATSAHLEILLAASERDAWPQVATAMRGRAGVEGAAPWLARQGLVALGSQVHGVEVLGVDPASEGSVSEVVPAEELAQLVPGSFKALLGRRLGERLEVAAGERIVLVAPTGTATLGGVVPRFKRVEVAGFFATGIHQYDSAFAYMHIDDVATLFKTSGADAVRLRLADVYRATALGRALEAEGHRTRDWTTANSVLFNALAVERRVMFVILSLIVAVAAFQIVAALVAMVRAKRGAIAILRTIGMSPAAIGRIFLIQGMLVGLAGTLVGVALGIVVALNVNPIVEFVEQAIGFDFFPGEVYLLETIPSELTLASVVGVATLAFALSLLATIFPSLAAARVEPAEALRHE